MTTKKSALGKGLSALISDAEPLKKEERFAEYEGGARTLSPLEKLAYDNAQASGSTSGVNPTAISEIPLDKITPNPYQPRTSFDEEGLQELTDSIKLLGLIQPITVRSIGSKYQIISGERRYRAALKAGLTTIPAYIRKADDQGMLEMAIVENIQREDLDAIEIAISFRRLIEECNLTQEAMAERVGKKRTTITNYLRLLKLPAEIQSLVRLGKVSMGHARALLSLEKQEEQLKLCNLTIKKELSVRQLEAKIQEALRGEEKPKKEEINIEFPETYYRLLEIVGQYFNNNISLKRSEKGSGSITIQFANDGEVEDFLKALERFNL